MHFVFDADGLTREVAGGAPNAHVAIASDPAKVVGYFTDRLAK